VLKVLGCALYAGGSEWCVICAMCAWALSAGIHALHGVLRCVQHIVLYAALYVVLCAVPYAALHWKLLHVLEAEKDVLHVLQVR